MADMKKPIHEQDVIISCTRCTSNIPISQTTYENNTKNLICFNCYNKLAKGVQPDRLVQSAEAPQKLNYKCIACGYSFSRLKEFQFGGHCFHCGKPTVQLEQSTESLTKDRKSLLDY